jgi:HSP20 family protein
MTSVATRPSRQSTAMPVNRWDPAQDLEDLHSQMAQLMQGFFGDPYPGAAATAWAAPADIEETDDAFIVDLDLPAAKPEDVNLELRENTLRVSGEIKEKQRAGLLRRQTRRVGQFEYLVALPGDVDPDKVEATLHDGVLSVRLGKSKRGKSKRINVKAS